MERDLPLEACQGRTQAIMHPQPERHVPVRLPGQVERIRLLEWLPSRSADARAAKTRSPRGIVTPPMAASSRA